MLTGRLGRHGETGGGGAVRGVLPASKTRWGSGLGGSTCGGLQGSYEDHVTHSSAAQSGGLAL